MARASQCRERMFRLMIVAAVVAALDAALLNAQAGSPDVMSRLRRGVHMRAVLREGAQPLLRGRVESTSGDTVAVRVHQDSVARHALGDLSTLEVLRRSRAAEGLSEALFVVGVVGGATGYVHWCTRNANACAKLDEDPDPYDDETPTPSIITVPLITGLLMAGLGYALAPPRWQSVDLPVRFGVAPMRNGAAFYVTVRTR